MYLTINEEAARIAHYANSMREFRPGAATAEYRGMVDRAREIADKQKGAVDSMYHEKIDRLLASYECKLAENLNAGFHIEARCPSVLIAGPSNFPVRKKEKQNAAREKNHQEYIYIAGLLDKIRATGAGGISSSDPNAVEKLEEKLNRLEASQAEMKRINAYYRKNKTLDGCPDLSEDFIAKMKAAMARDWRTNPKPYEAYSLQNNNANIRRVRERIAALKAAAENNKFSETAITEGVKLIENPEIDRIQFLFDGKPDADTRKELKSRGFVWSPKNLAWQRKLNGNGRYAAQQIVSFLSA